MKISVLLICIGFPDKSFNFLVRCVLAIIVLGSLQKFRSAIRDKFGPETAIWHLLITSSQFHLMFYASRPLPNIFALALALNASAFWIKGRYRQRFLIKLGIKPKYADIGNRHFFPVYHVIVRPTKIINRANTNWTHF